MMIVMVMMMMIGDERMMMMMMMMMMMVMVINVNPLASPPAGLLSYNHMNQVQDEGEVSRDASP